MDAADVKLFRIGDRSLAQLLSGYQFLRQLDGYDIGNLADQTGRAGLGRRACHRQRAQQGSHHQLPGRRGAAQPQARRLCADRAAQGRPRAIPGNRAPRSGSSSPTSACPPIPARTASTSLPARSARAKPIAGVELTLLAKNNEILGTAKTDADGRATFNPGLTRGEGGMVPAVLMATQRRPRFRLPRHDARPASTFPTAASTGRAAPGALDVYAWTERGIYRAGETVHVAALARDGSAKAVENLPLTFIFSRPDGVEDRRIVSDGASAGGHAVDLAAVLRRHARHLDGRDPHRPEGAGGRQPDVPGRGLRSGPHRVRPDHRQDRNRGRRDRRTSPSTAASSMARRPPASRSKARSTLSTKREWEASRAISSASPTSRKARRRASR